MKSGRLAGEGEHWRSLPPMPDEALVTSVGLEAILANARPRVIAALVRHFNSVDLAEDAFQDACEKAIRTWTDDGVARDPTAWLIVVARRSAIDGIRKSRRRAGLLEAAASVEEPPDPEEELLLQLDQDELRDDVLRLMFMCCQPDLPLHDQLALALKVIAGFPVDKIARAFVIQPKTMEQRITRAKKKAASVATRLETPTLQERARRLNAVSLMIYLLFNEGYTASGGDIHIREELCEEAIRLARLLLMLFPAQAEVMGLLALCLLQHSRRRARIGEDGKLIALEDQDRGKWEPSAISEGRALLEKALRHGRPGAYQVQAAIAAVHCAAPTSAETDWREIEQLYAALEKLQPSPVVSLNRAVAMSKALSPEAALRHLEPVADSLSNYIYYHTTLASLFVETEQFDAAWSAYERALQLGPTDQQAGHIRDRMRFCEDSKIKSAPSVG